MIKELRYCFIQQLACLWRENSLIDFCSFENIPYDKDVYNLVCLLREKGKFCCSKNKMSHIVISFLHLLSHLTFDLIEKLSIVIDRFSFAFCEKMCIETLAAVATVTVPQHSI